MGFQCGGFYVTPFLNSVLQIDSSTDLNVTNNSASKEYTFSTPDKNYIKISCNGKWSSSGAASYIYLKIEIKEVGGSYSTLMDERMCEGNGAGSAGFSYYNRSQCYHALSDNQKKKGYVVKITITGNSSNDLYTNRQIVFEGI